MFPEHNSLNAGGKQYIISEIMSVLTFATQGLKLNDITFIAIEHTDWRVLLATDHSKI